MGCGGSCVSRTRMALFGKDSNNDGARTILERKLFIAKQSPEPEFDLSDCQLKHIPPGIFSLCKVYRKECLYLQNNKLNSLYEGGQISNLNLIRILNLNSNQFVSLPDDICVLVNLTELHVSNNLLKSLPESIESLQNLHLLDASKNMLTHLTPSLGKLISLRKLNITGNPDLKKLCSELSHAVNILDIQLDQDQFIFPPAEICQKGTEEIMKYLCKTTGSVYKPSPPVVSLAAIAAPTVMQNPFLRNAVNLKKEKSSLIQQQYKLHKEKREKFLSEIVKNQQALDSEILKVHEAKETERQNLIKTIQSDEFKIKCFVKNFVRSDNLKPEVIQQQLAYEQAEHDRLLEITRQKYDNIKRHDVLKAMETLIEEDLSRDSKRIHIDSVSDMKNSLLLNNLGDTEKLQEILKAKDQSRTVLVGKLLEDQNVQKAAVATLLERMDTKTWSLNQEISLISANLARLSIIEQEKKNLHLSYNYNELLHQRVHLVYLLDDLFAQQSKRRKQLVDTLSEIEVRSSDTSDFWLQYYQKLLDSAPKNLLNIGKALDPMLANNLLQEGVIHCLPFLVKFLFSDEPLITINAEQLEANGVSLPADREGILKAIKDYVASKSENHNYVVSKLSPPSAPHEEPAEEQTFLGVVDSNGPQYVEAGPECVVCMDARSQVVFYPCGHMCCCQNCGKLELRTCPMCRTTIERIIKVIIP